MPQSRSAFYCIQSPPPCHDLAKWLSHYLYFFSWTYNYKVECGKVLCNFVNHWTKSSWLYSGLEFSFHTLELDSILWALSTLDLAQTYSHLFSTLSHWSSRSAATSIHSQALGLRGLCSQLGTAGGDTVPSSGIAFETWPHNWVVFSSILVLFLV